MIGAQTIGNATLIAYDDTPILSTDPWLGSSDYAYFGSWVLNYEIPKNLRKDIHASSQLVKRNHLCWYQQSAYQQCGRRQGRSLQIRRAF